MLGIILKTLKNVATDNVLKNVPINVPLKRLAKIIKLIKKNKNITLLEIAHKLNVTDKTIKRDIAKLKDENKIKRIGSLKAGHWELVDQIQSKI